MKYNKTDLQKISRGDGVKREILKRLVKSKPDGPFQNLRRGRVTRNPFLNFMRDVRKSIRGVGPLELSVKGAIIWRSMSDHEKVRYQQMAQQAPKIKSRRRRRRRRYDDVEVTKSRRHKSRSRKSRKRCKDCHTEAKRRGSRTRSKGRRKTRKYRKRY